LSISRNLFMHGHGYFFRHNINYLRKKLNFRCIDMSRVHFAPVGINRRSERWVNDVKITIKDFYSILTENMSDAEAEYVTRCVKHERSSRNNQPIYYMRDLDAKWDFDVIARPVAFFRTAAAIPPLSAFLVLMRALIDCDYKNNLRYVILGEDHFIGMYAQYLPIYFPDLCFLQFGVPRSETNNESHEYTAAPIKPRLYLYSSNLADAFDSLRPIGEQSLLFIHTECAAARTKKERTAYWKDCVAAIDKIRPKYYIIDTYGDASAAGEIVFGPYAFALSEMNFLVNAAAVPTGAALSSTSAERADYKSKNFYFKQVTRSFAMKQHAYGDEEWGFDFCNDCANTAAILENYKKYSGDRSSMMQLVRTLIPSTASSCHGYLFNNDDAEWIKQAQHLKFYHFAPRVDAHTDIISHNRSKGHKHDVSAKTPLAQIMRDSQSENYP
jgi:hypothetical protein